MFGIPFKFPIVLFLFLFPLIGQCNDIMLNGRLTDKQTGEPVPFVSLGIVGTTRGAVSDADGRFKIKIKPEDRDGALRISAVGYETYTVTIADALKKEPFVIRLAPKVYEGTEVTVTGKSRRAQNILKKAFERINENYLKGPFNYEMYYRTDAQVKGEANRSLEAVLELYDQSGYGNRDFLKAFQNINYQVIQTKRNFEANSLKGGSINPDEVLSSDIVRIAGNILDKNYTDSYSFSIEKDTDDDQDDVWVIDYECKDPSLSRTGDFYASSYKGRIYVNKKDYAVIKNITYGESSATASAGKSFAASENSIKRYDKIKYRYTVTYREERGKYRLDKISYDRYQEEVILGKKQKERINTELIITKVNSRDPVSITGRSYYEELPFDEEFWKNYNFADNSSE